MIHPCFSMMLMMGFRPEEETPHLLFTGKIRKFLVEGIFAQAE